MGWLFSILESLAFMVLTIVVLGVALYMALLVLQWGLRLKSGTREEEGLADLWQTTMVSRSTDAETGADERPPSYPP